MRNDFFPIACAILGMAPTIKDMEIITLDDGDPHYVESNTNYPILDADFEEFGQ